MSKVMKTTSLPVLLERIAGEYLSKRTIFEIPETTWLEVFDQESESAGLSVMSSHVSIPLGPAAGPHTQIAPNLIAAYLCGARVFELKTVQENDHLDIDKPCIDALDEGHNVEWSTELTLDQARIEYLNAWITINFLARIWSHKPNDFLFNMSVGYTLDGIKSEKMEAFIEGMRRPEASDYWGKAIEDLQNFIESSRFIQAFGQNALERARSIAEHMPVRPIHSVTLSTMHGCPPDEIERIGRYLIEEKGFDTYIKLNPTLIGYDRAREILDRLGWTDIILRRENFEHDLQFDSALNLIQKLSEVTALRGRRFGIKLSNTLANVNDGVRLPGGERYMSGRALFPITIHLAAELARALPDFPARFSYCGGVSAFNAGDLIKAGLGPLTIVTDILKPGGYQRMAHMVRDVVNAIPYAPEKPDAEALEALANGVFTAPWYHRSWKEGTASIARDLPLFDCFAAPCVEACPVHQKAPAYIEATGSGDPGRGFSIILSDNPLPTITGVLCDHVCQEHCSRVDYEGAVRIRDVKLATVRAVGPGMKIRGSIWPQPAIGATAVIGAGPAGLACAWYLAQYGQRVVVFDRRPAPGGVPAHIIPSFRLAQEDLTEDVARLEQLGVEFRFGVDMRSPEELRAQGFDTVFIAIGADKPKGLDLKGEGVRVLHALDFLDACKREGVETFQSTTRVLVVGGGNTACDAVRMAVRLPSIQSVHWSYRRTHREMPADTEEFGNALSEAATCNRQHGAGQPLLELTLPEVIEPGKVILRRMKLGEKDTSGRMRPVPTDEIFSLPCDLLITAVGEEPDFNFLRTFGIECDEHGRPLVDATTMEACPGIFVGGDARRGPSSIIAAEADGRAAALSILAHKGVVTAIQDYRSPAWSPKARATRGRMLPSLDFTEPAFAAREAERCLHCDSACLRCVEVCPNRANMVLETGRDFDQSAQILHIDRLCNECGNCGLFCPWNGEPYKAKATLFDTREELANSQNAGFAFCGDAERPTLILRAVVGGVLVELPYLAWNGTISRPTERQMIALARIVWGQHRYLVEVRA